MTEAWGLCLCSIVGVFWGAFAEREPQHNAGNLREWLARLAEGKLRPHISATYPLEQAADALYEMLNRRVQGKVVLVIMVCHRAPGASGRRNRGRNR